ncbi:MAG TPA: DNA-3-methyladenine glycosylase [Acidobacteriaceae bacterium]|nr:DNA-3-methyladenine glycosylase [Acidobacteriaceae bacterium]
MATDPLTGAGMQPLPRSFFDAEPELVARQLIGKLLVRRQGGYPLVGRIVETEAYLGEHDPAAHAASGRTPRNAVLYGPPGHAYVYGIYGLHFCLNVSCLGEGFPGCVLVRALEPVEGLDAMRANRSMTNESAPWKLASGPGKLCQALQITRAADNGTDLTDIRGNLGLYQDDFACGEIRATARIGISKAADLPLRFFLSGNPCVSPGASRASRT